MAFLNKPKTKFPLIITLLLIIIKLIFNIMCLYFNDVRLFGFIASCQVRNYIMCDFVSFLAKHAFVGKAENEILVPSLTDLITIKTRSDETVKTSEDG